MAFAVATLFGFSCLPAVAGEITEEDIFAGIPMVVSATRLPQPVDEAPVSITVLDRELIEASGAIEIYDLLRLVPGMQIGMTWRDHHASFSYHGQSDGLSRRMQVLIDGRVALGSQFGLTDWDRLGIVVQDIERIEVVRGTAGATYGSNAFVGAINIITKDSVTAPSWQMSATTGSTDLTQANLRYSHSDEKLDYQLGIGYFETDGFDGVNDETEVSSVRLKGRYQLAMDQSLELQLGYATGPAGRGGGTIPVIDPVGSTDMTEEYMVLRWTKTPSLDNEWYVQFGYNANRETDRNYIGVLSDFLGDPLPPGFVDEGVWAGPYDLHADRADLEVQQTLTLSENSRLVWGGGARQNRMKGYLAQRGPDYFYDRSGRVYGNWEYRIDNWLLNTGAMFEDGDLASGNLSFRLGANYRLQEGHTFRLSYAEGWRHPFIGEAFHEVGLKTASGVVVEAFLGARIIPEPEKINTYEIGFVSEWFNGSLKTDVKLFTEKLKRELVEVIDPTVPELISILGPGAVTRVNGGETDIRGGELNLDYSPWQGGRIWASYSYASVDQLSPVMALRDLQNLDATPRHTASLSLSQQFGDRWQASLNYYYMDEMAWQVWGTDLEQYDRFDARLAKDFHLGGAEAKLELIGQNLLGSGYSEFSINNTFDSRAFVRFSLKFN